LNFTATIANALWSASNFPAYIRFSRALALPEVEQNSRLRAYLHRNASTAFGKAHRFDKIQTYDEFARRVPLTEYDGLQSWIEGARRSEPNILTREPVTHLIPTSGTTSGRKLIPFTAGLEREFNAAIGPWLIDLARQVPDVICGPAYWSVTPVIQDAEPTAPGFTGNGKGTTETPSIPIGFDSDTAYLGCARSRLADRVMAVPEAVQHSASLGAFRYTTLLWLLRCRDLRLISVWHPSFLSLLLDVLSSHWEHLLVDIEKGACSYSAADVNPADLKPLPQRARELRAIDPRYPISLWPSLRVISCWADGPAALATADLQRRFPASGDHQVLFQPKGLLATEAFVTLPFGLHHPLAITSHFFEFLDDRGRVHLAHTLRRGAEYEVVVTTAGGLWRYRLGDRVLVDGFVEKTPSLRFLGRNGNVSDRFGEKLSEAFVAEAMREVFSANLPQPRFALLAPDEDADGGRYTLYVEGNANSSWTERLDEALRRNPHYAYCRDLGQLGRLRLFLIAEQGYETYAAQESARGARLGDIKPAVLSKSSGWSDIFSGSYLEAPIHQSEYSNIK